MTTHQQKQSLEKWMRWERRGVPSSHWTIALSDQWYLVCLLALTVFHLILSGLLPPTEDELYYWSWAQHLQLSYYDHPPMVAVFIRLSTLFLGNNIFAVRFLASITHLVIFLILGTLTPGKNILGLLLLTPLALFGSVLMTPDVPLLLFWTLYIFWLCQINQSFSQWGDDPVSRVYRSQPINWRQWVVGGVLLGFGLLGKYSMILAIPCTFFVLLTKHRLNSWITGFSLHLLTALIVASPIFFFNWHYQFIPFKFQWNHALSDGSGVFLEFLGNQALLLGALPLLIFGWVLLRGKDLCSHPNMQVCFYFFMLAFLFTLFLSAKTHVEANWALMSYIAFWPLAQYLLNQNSFRLLGRVLLTLSFLPPIAVSGLCFFHLVKPLTFFPPEKDRLAKTKAVYELTKEIAKDLQINQRSAPVYLPTYQLTSYFRYLGINSEQLFPLGRASNFTLDPAEPCREKSVLFLGEIPSASPPNMRCFGERELLKEYPLIVRGKQLQSYYLIEYFR